MSRLPGLGGPTNYGPHIATRELQYERRKGADVVVVGEQSYPPTRPLVVDAVVVVPLPVPLLLSAKIFQLSIVYSFNAKLPVLYAKPTPTTTTTTTNRSILQY